jgi:hypothetical protein
LNTVTYTRSDRTNKKVGVLRSLLPAQPRSNSKAATRNDLNYVASSSGLMTATPSDASVDEMVPGDIATAKAFGARVAAATAKLA